MIAFGINQGIGNIIQAESAIACLRKKGLKVYVNKDCTWDRGWEVLSGRVDGFIDNDHPDVKHFIMGSWARPSWFPNAKQYAVPYEPINQIDLYWKAANKFYKFNFGKSLDKPVAPRLFEQWLGPENEDDYIAVHPASTLHPKGWQLKLYKDWEKLIIDLLDAGEKVAIVGMSKIDKYESKWDLNIRDVRKYATCSPSEHIDFLTENCKALITSASGWAFMGAAIGIPTYVLWGPDSLTRNRPLGANVHILKHDNCQECFKVQTLRTEIPECPYNNKCMNHTSEGVISALKQA